MTTSRGGGRGEKQTLLFCRQWRAHLWPFCDGTGSREELHNRVQVPRFDDSLEQFAVPDFLLGRPSRPHPSTSHNTKTVVFVFIIRYTNSHCTHTQPLNFMRKRPSTQAQQHRASEGWNMFALCYLLWAMLCDRLCSHYFWRGSHFILLGCVCVCGYVCMCAAERDIVVLFRCLILDRKAGHTPFFVIWTCPSLLGEGLVLADDTVPMGLGATVDLPNTQMDWNSFQLPKLCWNTCLAQT